MGLQERPLHRQPIGALDPLILGCVGCFFESVVRRLLNSGCRLKTVVGFEFYSSGCTSYPYCLQVVILFVILRHEDRDSIYIHPPEEIIGILNERVTRSSRSAHLSCFTNTLFLYLSLEMLATLFLIRVGSMPCMRS
jgi:hypothetical protein